MGLTMQNTGDTIITMREPRSNLKIDPELRDNLKILAVLTKRTMHQVIKDHVDAELKRLGYKNTEKASK